MLESGASQLKKIRRFSSKLACCQFSIIVAVVLQTNTSKFLYTGGAGQMGDYECGVTARYLGNPKLNSMRGPGD
jgi:hypothetical protein